MFLPWVGKKGIVRAENPLTRGARKILTTTPQHDATALTFIKYLEITEDHQGKAQLPFLQPSCGKVK